MTMIIIVMAPVAQLSGVETIDNIEYDAISWAKSLWWDIQVRPGYFDANMTREDRDRYIKIAMVTLINASANYLLKDPYLFDRK